MISLRHIRCFLCFVAFSSVAGNALAQDVFLNDRTWSRDDGWHVYQTKQINGCVAEKIQDDGTVFLLALINDDANLAVGFSNERLTKLADGQLHELTISFDGRSPQRGKYNGFTSNNQPILMGGYPGKGDFYRDIGRANSVRFSSGKTQLAQVSLIGSTATLATLAQCKSEADTAAYSAQQSQQINQSNAFNEQAVTLFDLGKYADAIPYYQQALAIREQVLGPDHPLVAESLNNLGAGLSALGDFPKAESAYRRALEIRESAFGEVNLLVAETLNNLGALHYDKGDYAAAQPYYRRSLEIRERLLGSNDLKIAGSLNNLANALQQQGELEQAEALHRRSLTIRQEILEDTDPQIALSKSNLANLLQNKGELDEAEELQRSALTIRERGLGPGHPSVADSLNNLAALLTVKGAFQEVIPLHRRALQIREKTFGRDHARVADTLHNLGTVHTEIGEYEKAEEFYNAAIAIKEKALPPNHPELADTLNNFANLAFLRKEYSTAIEFARKAAKSGHPKRGAYLAALHAQKNSDGTIAESFEVVQMTAQSASGAALQMLSSRFAGGTGELADLVRKEQDSSEQLQRLNALIVAEASKLPDERDRNRETQIRERIGELERQLALIHESLGDSFPDYAQLSRPQSVSAVETQNLLQSDEALLVLDIASVDEGDDYVWALTGETIRFERLATRQGEVAAAITELRKGLDLNNYDRRAIDPGAAHALFKRILAPVYELVSDKPHLVFVLNGAVSSLPPQVLVTESPDASGTLRNASWLVRDHAVTVLPTVSSLKLLRTGADASKPPKPFIGFGDPVFDPNRENGETRTLSRSYSDFFRGTKTDIEMLRVGLTRLPATADEVEAIGASLGAPKEDIVLRSEASEATVKQAPLEQYNIIYFATHGLVAGEVELVAGSGAEPALAFSVPSEATLLDDGLLTASEVAQLRLNADWVVMSACNTAAGDRPGADALSGLARSFFYAGARSLVVSHWVVDDAATAELMKRTFELAGENDSQGAAFAHQRAMLSLIEDSENGSWADPAYWAPFVLVGEPRR